jgi:hypothetical protein
MLVAIRRMYEDAYAALYVVTLRRWRDDEYMASFMAAVGLGGAVGLNFALVILLWKAYCRSELSLPPAVDLLPIAPLALNYWLFVYRDRYDAVVQRFAKLEKAQRRRMRIATGIYVIASYAIPLLLALVLASVSN